MHKLLKYRTTHSSHCAFIVTCYSQYFLTVPFMNSNISYVLSPKDWTYTYNVMKLRNLSTTKREIKGTKCKLLYLFIFVILHWVMQKFLCLTFSSLGWRLELFFLFILMLRFFYLTLELIHFHSNPSATSSLIYWILMIIISFLLLFILTHIPQRLNYFCVFNVMPVSWACVGFPEIFDDSWLSVYDYV